MKNRLSLAFLASSLLFLPLLPACGKNTDTPTGPTEIQINDVTVGTGAAAATGDTVSVYYIGAFLDGTVFDSSARTGVQVPYTFKLGAGQVIKGFDQGTTGMKVGGRRVVVIPSNLAYGATGSGSIPPNTPVQFQIDLISIAPQ